MRDLREIRTAKDSRRVWCLLKGNGDANVMLLHGNPSVPWVYEQFIDALPAERYRIVAIDWYGDSDAPRGGYQVSGFVDQAREVLDALCMPSATLVGHSLGGITALLMALRYPERVDKLVLVGTGASVEGHGTIPKMLAAMASGRPAEELLRDMAQLSYGSLPPSERLDRYIDHLLKHPLSTYAEAMRSALLYDLRPLLGRITAPTLVIHGTSDNGRTKGHAQTLLQGISDSRLVELDCGHYVMEEQAEEFNAQVVEFLAAVWGAP
jgi:pimeloyl-ACP methyl ester carboxylesterase